MYRAIIVEDETDIRRGLRDCVDWGSYGIAVVCDAANGRDALAYVRDHPVDIIITDVVMPIMDGIELVTRAQAQTPHVKAVFISGYQDVDYIKGAFKVSAIDYIFKPVDMAELDAALGRVVAQCDADAAQEAAREASLVLRQQAYLVRILDGTIADQSILDELRIEWVTDQVHVAVAVQAAGPSTRPSRRIQLDEVVSGLVGSLDHCSTPARITPVAGVSPPVVIVSSERAGDGALAHRIGAAVVSAFTGHRTTSVGIGPASAGVDGLRYSYRGAVRAADLAFFSGYNRVYTQSDLGRGLEDDPVPIDHATRNVVDAVLTGQRCAVRPALKGFLSAVVDHSPRDPAIARALAIDLLFRAASGLRSAGMTNAASTVAELEGGGLQACRTLDEIYTRIAGPLEEAGGAVEAMDLHRAGFVVERMKAFLRARLACDVTIGDLAGQFLLTPNYVSALFKKKTGRTVREYLTSQRVEKAKELLGDPRLRLYDIADSVGYRDRDHFTKTFRRHTGMTPKQYRDQELA